MGMDMKTVVLYMQTCLSCSLKLTCSCMRHTVQTEAVAVCVNESYMLVVVVVDSERRVGMSVWSCVGDRTISLTAYSLLCLSVWSRLMSTKFTAYRCMNYLDGLKCSGVAGCFVVDFECFNVLLCCCCSLL